MVDRLIPQINGPRGTELLGIALLATFHGVAYYPWEGRFALPYGLQLIDQFVPVAVYAFAWLIVAVLATVASLRGKDGWERTRTSSWAFAGAFSLVMVWSFSYGLGWALSLLGDQPPVHGRGLLAGFYLSLGIILAASRRVEEVVVIRTSEITIIRGEEESS